MQAVVRHDRQFAKFVEILGKGSNQLLLPEYGHLCDQIKGFAKRDGRTIKEYVLEAEYQHASYAARLFMDAVKQRVPADQLRHFPRALVTLCNCTGIVPRQKELAREISPFLVPTTSKPSLATPRG